MALQEQQIEGSCGFICGSSLWYLSTMISHCDHKHCDSGDAMFLICQVTYV